jgi:hypothetical protein
MAIQAVHRGYLFVFIGVVVFMGVGLFQAQAFAAQGVQL